MKPRLPFLTTDASLVRRALHADAAALEALVLRYQARAHAVARGQGVPRHTIEDVVQEGFLHAIRDLPRLRDHRLFGPWFLGIVRNAARDVLREMTRRGTEPLREDVAAEEPGPIEDDSRERLWAKVAELPEATREAIFLYYHEGESTRAVARALGISIPAVKGRLEHGRKLLREKLWREVEESCRRTMPSREERRRGVRRLTLALLAAPPWAALEARAGASTGASGPLQGAGYSKLATIGAFMSGKKVGFGVAGLLLLFGASAAWWAGSAPRERDLAREARPAGGGVQTAPDRQAFEVPVPAGPEVAVETPAARGEPAIEGAVWIIEPGNPAARAKVAAIPSGEERHAAVVEAGDDGRFRIEGLGPGSYILWAWRGTWTAADRSQGIELREGSSSEPVDVVLVPGAVVDVEVVEEGTGAPVPGAIVRYRDLQFAETDLDGRCRLDGVRAGQIGIHATARGLAVGVALVDAAPGENASAVMELAPGGSITGHVTWAGGEPAEGARVIALVPGTRGSWTSASSRAGSEGRYEIIGVPLRQRNIQVTASFEGRFTTRAEVPGFPENGSVRLDLELSGAGAAGSIALAGRVVDGDGETVQGASVFLDRARGPGAAFTGAGGAFRIEGAPEDVARIAVRKPGHAPAARDVRGLSPEEREAIEVLLEPGRHVAGIVVDSSGTPLEAASVNVWGTSGPVGSAWTGASGKFRIEDLPGSLRDIWASKPGYAESRGNAVEPGREDHRLLLEEDGAIEGVVLDGSTGAAVRDFTVRVFPGKGAGGMGADLLQTGLRFRRPDGRFTVRGLTAGATYGLLVAGPEHEEAVVEEIEARRSSGAREPVRIDLSGGSVLEGIVISGATEEPIAGVRVKHLGGPHYDPSAKRFQPFLVAFQVDNPTFRTTVSDAGGRFVLRGLSAAPGTLVLDRPSFARTAISPFVPGDGRQVFRLPAEAALEGLVAAAGGEPLEGVEVSVHVGELYFPPARSGAGGRYRMEGLPAGEAGVRASRPLGLRLARTVTLRAGDVATLDIIEEAGSIRGAVRAGEEPAPSARVSIRRRGAESEETFAITDAKGFYAARGLPPGKYEVSAGLERDWRHAFVVSPLALVDVGPGETRCDLEFPRGALRGRVVDRSSGAPRKETYVEIHVRAAPVPGGEPGGWTLAGERHVFGDLFELDAVPPGAYCITGSDRPRGPVAGWAPVHVADGASVETVLALGGEGSLDVEVVDGAGRAIREPSIELRPEDLPGVFEPAAGDPGKRRVENLPPARYVLEVEAPGHERHSEVVEMGAEPQSRTVRLAPRQ